MSGVGEGPGMGRRALAPVNTNVEGSAAPMDMRQLLGFDESPAKGRAMALGGGYAARHGGSPLSVAGAGGGRVRAGSPLARLSRGDAFNVSPEGGVRRSGGSGVSPLPVRASPGVDDAMRRLRKELEEEKRGHAIARVALEAAERQLTELERGEARAGALQGNARRGSGALAGGGAESPGAKLQQALQSALAGRERAGREIEDLKRQLGQLRSEGAGAPSKEEGRKWEGQLREEAAGRAHAEEKYAAAVARAKDLENTCRELTSEVEAEVGKRAQAEENFKNVVVRAKNLENNCGELTAEVKACRKLHSDAVKEGEAAKKVAIKLQRDAEALRAELAAVNARMEEVEGRNGGCEEGASAEINALSQVVRDMAAALKLAEEERDARLDDEEKHRELLAKLEHMLDEQNADLNEAEKNVKVERARVQELEKALAKGVEDAAAEWKKREATLNEQLKLSRDEVIRLKEDTAVAREQERRAESELVLGLRDELGEAETSLAHARGSLETARAALDVKAREIQGLETVLAERNAQVEKLREGVERLEREVDTASAAGRQKMEQSISTVREMEAKMKCVEREMTQEADSLRERLADTTRRTETLEGALAEETATTMSLRGEISRLERELSMSARDCDSLRQVADQSLKRATEAGQSHSEEIRRLTLEMSARECRIRALEDDKRDLIERLKTMANMVRSQISVFRAEMSANREDILKTHNSGMTELAEGRRLAFDSVRSIGHALNALQVKLTEEASKRKRLQNIVADLRGNIRVHCRVRPPSPEEARGLAAARSVVNVVPDETGHGIGEVEIAQVRSLSGALTPARMFEFDGVYGPEASQQDVFELSVLPLVSSVLDGYNACVFAYGQTGSGKTFTMEGPTVKGMLSDENMAGVNYRALDELFKGLNNRGESTRRSGELIEVSASCVEIYNEAIRDLLDPDNAAGASNSRASGYGVGEFSAGLTVGRLHATGERVIQGLTEVPVGSASEVRGLMRRAARARATSATSMNERSSRSHCILMVKVVYLDAAAPSVILRQSKLNLVDLAGSERVKKSEAAGDRMKEAQAINKSLSALGDVISALRTKQGHVPFRNSKLTYLLEDSLSGSSKILMFVNISPDERQVGETTCSLQFASRARAVELGRAVKNTAPNN